MISGNSDLALEKISGEEGIIARDGTDRHLAILDVGKFYAWVENEAGIKNGQEYICKQSKNKREDMLLEWKWGGHDKGANYLMESTENYCLEMITPIHLGRMDKYDMAFWGYHIKFALLCNNYRQVLGLKEAYIAASSL